MIPYHIWGARCLNEVIVCQGCNEPVVVGDAIAYRYTFFVKDGVTYGGYFIFHDYDCLLHRVDIRAIGHA